MSSYISYLDYSLPPLPKSLSYLTLPLIRQPGESIDLFKNRLNSFLNKCNDIEFSNIKLVPLPPSPTPQDFEIENIDCSLPPLPSSIKLPPLPSSIKIYFSSSFLELLPLIRQEGETIEQFKYRLHLFLNK